MEPAVTGLSVEVGTEVRKRSPQGVIGAVEADDSGRCGSREVIVIDDSE